MAPLTRSRLSDAAIVTAVLGLPLLGATLTRRDLMEVFLFPPPLRIPSDYLRFSWLAVAAVVALLVSIVLSWIAAARRRAVQMAPESCGTRHSAAPNFPWWGWIAFGWTVGWWALAWTRYPCFESVQRYTFFPLWLGFIVAVNALTHRRAGTCMMRRNPRLWGGLFFTSALYCFTNSERRFFVIAKFVSPPFAYE